jgi:hypothetical protein
MRLVRRRATVSRYGVFSEGVCGCFTKSLVDTMIWETLAADRRRALRRPLGHLGTIRAEPGSTPHYCLVIDDSDEGVRVSTSHDYDVPDEFVLRLSGNEAKYKVVWRKGRQVGAKLVRRARRAT